MDLRRAGLLLLTVATVACAQGPQRPTTAVQPRVGINLHGPCDWNTELPFVDVFRMSRAWISQREGQGWGKGPALQLDEHGWVQRLEPNCRADTPVCMIEGNHYPSGIYTVYYQGQGKIDFWNAGKLVSQRPGELKVQVDASRGAVWLRLSATDPNDPVRDIHMIMPGFEETWQEEPFHPVFLQRWQGFDTIRFMDWMRTNQTTIAQWSDRPTVGDMTFSDKGVALEWMIDLANRLHANPWFCLPHLADDDYVRHFAQQVKEQLAPDLKVYLEYSNEVWNGQFPQSRYAGQIGQKLGLGDKPWEAGWRYTARRSVQIFRIWSEVFGGHDRLVRVLPTQAANPYVSRQILGFEDAAKEADALAIAPYLSMVVPARGEGLTADVVATWSLDQVFGHLQQTVLPQTEKWLAGQKQAADEYGVKLIAYEGGQHLVGHAGGENNQELTALFQRANADPRMGRLYRQYSDAWDQVGGDLFCTFSSVGTWSKWGSWGLLQYYDDDPATAPKYQAVVDWAKRCGQQVSLVSP